MSRSKVSRGNGRQKHVPQRTCIACRETLDKRQLNRIVYTDEGLIVDPTGKRSGRGAYLCQKDSCWEQITGADLLERALRVSLTTDEKNMLNELRPGV